MKILKLRFILPLILILSSCEKAPERYTNIALDVGFKDIAVTLIAYTKDESTFNTYFQLLTDAFSTLGHLYDKYTNFENIVNLKTLNDTAGTGPKGVDQALIDLFNKSKDWTEKSEYTFNPTLGAVLNIWHDYRDEGKLLNSDVPTQYGSVPLMSALELANACTGWENILIDDAANTIEILNPCTQVDVGGIAKGFAADIVAEKLKAMGLDSAIINIGDSSILTIGSKPNGEEWGIGISKPTRPVLIGASTVDTLYFPSDISVSTSGDNQNYYVADDGKYYHHIIDPKTLFPVETSLHAVTVVTDLSAGDAEALSKAFFILSYDEAIAYYEQVQVLYPNNYFGVLWVYELNQAPLSAKNVIESLDFTLVHTDNLLEHSRLYR